MSIHPEALLTIALMAVMTYLCRSGGYWLMGRVSMSPRVETGLSYLPGAVLISLVAPAMAREGIPGVCAVVATAVVMRTTNNLLVSMITGVFTVWLVRQIV